MSRSNEELAALIHGGATEYIPELWEQISGLVKWKANRIMAVLEMRGSWGKCGIEFDDLLNTGFPALVEAVETYNPENGTFSSWFMYYLKTAYAELTGYRTKRQKYEPLNNAVSLNTPLSDEVNPDELADLVADPQAAALMESTDDALWRNQLHTVMEAALSDLPDDMGEILRERYWRGATLKDLAESHGTTPERLRQKECKAIRELRKPQHACNLISFYEFNYYSCTSLQSFRYNNASVQEKYLLIQEERRQRAAERERLRREQARMEYEKVMQELRQVKK